MAELRELNQKFLFSLKRELRAARMKYNRAYKHYFKIPFETFIENYATPVVNANYKIRALKEYFPELGVVYPKLPILPVEIYTATWYFYVVESHPGELLYKGEVIDFEHDHITTRPDPYFLQFDAPGPRIQIPSLPDVQNLKIE